jgi:hypothetical protein
MGREYTCFEPFAANVSVSYKNDFKFTLVWVRVVSAFWITIQGFEEDMILVKTGSV